MLNELIVCAELIHGSLHWQEDVLHKYLQTPGRGTQWIKLWSSLTRNNGLISDSVDERETHVDWVNEEKETNNSYVTWTVDE